MPQNKLINSLIALLLIMVAAVSHAQNRTAHQYDYQCGITGFYALPWHNPALMYNYPAANYTDVSTGVSYHRAKERYLPETGNTQITFRFNANSFVKQNNQVWFGSARYINGRRLNQKWNNVSDYQLVSPYIIADTIGGDSRFEQYFFEGGYAVHFKSLTLGLYGSYRAGVEYRRTDPRPLNTTSDLHLKTGTSFPLSNRYLLGVHLQYRSYKQKAAINNFGHRGTHKQFYMVGFGLNHSFFSKVEGNDLNYYELTGTELAIQLFPVAKQGIILNALANRHNLVQENSHGYRTVNRLQTRRLLFEGGYKWQSSHQLHQLKAFGEITKKDGWEYEYILPGSIFLQSIQKYERILFNAQLAWLTGLQSGSFSHYYSLTCGYHLDQSQHKSPEASYRINQIHTCLTGGGSYAFTQSVLSMKLNLTYAKTLHSELKTSHLAVPYANEQLVQSGFKYLAATNAITGATIRYDYYWSQRWGTYLKVHYYSIFYDDATATNSLLLTCGFTF